MALEWFDYVNDPENAAIAAEEGQPDDGRVILEGTTDGLLIYGIQQQPDDPKYYLTIQMESLPIAAHGFDTREQAKAKAEELADRLAKGLAGGFGGLGGPSE